jgi:hypothetical protein
MDRVQYCVLEFCSCCCQFFTITRAGGERCTAEFRLDLCQLRVKLGHSAMSAQCPDCPKADMEHASTRLQRAVVVIAAIRRTKVLEILRPRLYPCGLMLAARITLPHFRNMVPVLLTQTIILFQDTSLVYVLSITDFLTCEPFLRAMMRKPSCLISCSHWPPDGSLSVLLGRHGAMNPAGRVRCNMPT